MSCGGLSSRVFVVVDEWWWFCFFCILCTSQPATISTQLWTPRWLTCMWRKLTIHSSVYLVHSIYNTVLSTACTAPLLLCPQIIVYFFISLSLRQKARLMIISRSRSTSSRILIFGLYVMYTGCSLVGRDATIPQLPSRYIHGLTLSTTRVVDCRSGRCVICEGNYKSVDSVARVMRCDAPTAHLIAIGMGRGG